MTFVVIKQGKYSSKIGTVKMQLQPNLLCNFAKNEFLQLTYKGINLEACVKLLSLRTLSFLWFIKYIKNYFVVPLEAAYLLYLNFKKYYIEIF